MKAKNNSTPVNLTSVIKNLEEIILTSTGADAFEEILKLIIIKTYSEKINQSHISPRVLFNQAIKIWPGIFTDLEKIGLQEEISNQCLTKLEKIQLYKSDLSIIDAAFEHLLPTKAKGSRGQYFTPRHVIDEIIKMINPQLGEKILDPACGSGGFLLHTAKYTGSGKNLYGIDFDNQMLKVAKTICLISDNPGILIINANSLLDFNHFNFKQNKLFLDQSFDIIFTNPPFGGDINDMEVLKNYELAKDIKYKLRNHVERHILFIERIIRFLKPGGRAAIIVPQGILNNTNLNYIRKWLYSKARILGVIGLDLNTFKPYTNVKTSILLLQKFKEKPLLEYPVFMAVSQKSGKNLSGRLIFKIKNGKSIIDSDLPEITKKFIGFKKEQEFDF